MQRPEKNAAEHGWKHGWAKEQRPGVEMHAVRSEMIELMTGRPLNTVM